MNSSSRRLLRCVVSILLGKPSLFRSTSAPAVGAHDANTSTGSVPKCTAQSKHKHGLPQPLLVAAMWSRVQARAVHAGPLKSRGQASTRRAPREYEPRSGEVGTRHSTSVFNLWLAAQFLQGSSSSLIHTYIRKLYNVEISMKVSRLTYYTDRGNS
jgi:hypothetical protein